MIKTSSPSINPILNGTKNTEQVANQKTEETKPSSEQPKNNFTQEALETTWDAYANALKAKGKTNLATALLSKRPVLVNGSSIEFTINNKALEESMNEDKMNFLGFLRKELNNYSIQLNLIMTLAEDKTNLYTATDRYKHLAEKNPNINKLRQAFDLDVEF